MLDNLKLILNYKHSLVALFGVFIATITNLFFAFSINAVFLITVCLISTATIVLVYLQKDKVILTFSVFFILGLLSSSYYNYQGKIYPADEIIENQKAWVSGIVTDISLKDKYAKIELEETEIYSDIVKITNSTPSKTMLISTFSSRVEDIKIGDTLVTKVMFTLPKAKLFKDDFDYQEFLLQKNINLTGQVRGEIYSTPPEEGYSVLQKLRNYRLSLIDKINSNYSENRPVAGVTIALITGMKGFIPPEYYESFKKAGLAHLMAISGLHMAFIFGLAFLLIRNLICLFPSIALNYSSKKIAAIFGVAASFLYMIIAGATLPTIRAFLMVLLLAFTFLFNKSKISLHILCVVAMIFIITNPVVIHSVSFQLSFGAVLAIIFYNQSQSKTLIIDYSKQAKLIRRIFKVINISVVAFCATMPIVSYHFGFLSIFAIISNISVSFIISLIVMPILTLYYFGYLVFNLEIFSTLNNVAIGSLITISEYFANFDNSFVYISKSYCYILAICSLAVILVLSLNVYRKYLISLGILISVLAFPVFKDLRPKIIYIPSKQAAAIREENKMQFIGSLSRKDQQRLLAFYKTINSDFITPKYCDVSGCAYNFADKVILNNKQSFTATKEDILLADFITIN